MFFFLYVLIASSIIFWLFEKTRALFEYRQDRRTVRLHDELMASHTATLREAKAYYRARTWEIMRKGRNGRPFSEKDTQFIDEMGLRDYLKDNMP